MSKFIPNLELEKALPFCESEDEHMQDAFRELVDTGEEILDIEDQYQILVDDFDESNGGIQSLVSMTARENIPPVLYFDFNKC